MNVTRSDIFIASLGVEAYRVGGSVRDELLGRPSKDADYMIRGVSMLALGGALRNAVVPWPKHSVKPLVLRDGRQAGWRVSARGLGCLEIVLPRMEVPRDPFKGENVHRAFDIMVSPMVTLDEDARRRDFTFNALYMKLPEGVVHDPTGRGLYDLEHKLVSTTHPDSFRDDPLRTLRALRFVSALGYDLSTETFRQMSQHATAVTGLSAKGCASGTVIDELSKMLMGGDAVKALRIARDTGVLAAILPELAPMIGFDQRSRYHDMTTDEHTFTALETAVKVGAPLRVRWALLFHDSGKPESAWVGSDGRQHFYEPSDRVWDDLMSAHAQKIGLEDFELAEGPPLKPQDHEVTGEDIWRIAASRLGATKTLREDVAKLIRNHMVATRPRNPEVKVHRARVQFGDAMLRDLYMHRMCDITGKANKAVLGQVEDVGYLESVRQLAEKAGVPSSVRGLNVSGQDCINIALTGKRIGEVLHRLLDEVVCDPTEQKLSREWQLDRLGNL